MGHRPGRCSSSSTARRRAPLRFTFCAFRRIPLTTVLVTGAAGYIASYLLPAFRERYDLRLVDVQATDGKGRPVAGIQVRDVSDPRDLDVSRALFRGADAVVHLAFIRARGPAPADRYFAERANVDMAYAVYQIALEEGVRRMVV